MISAGHLLESPWGLDNDDFLIAGSTPTGVALITVVPQDGVQGNYQFNIGGPFAASDLLSTPVAAVVGEYDGDVTYGDVVLATSSPRDDASQEFCKGHVVKLHLFGGRRSGALWAKLEAEDYYCFKSGEPVNQVLCGECVSGCWKNGQCGDLVHYVSGQMVATGDLMPGGNDEVAIALQVVNPNTQVVEHKVWYAPGVDFGSKETLDVGLGQQIVGLAVEDITVGATPPDGYDDLILAIVDPDDGLLICLYRNDPISGLPASPTYSLAIADGPHSGRPVARQPVRFQIEDASGDGFPEILFAYERTIGGTQIVTLTPRNVGT